jgi:hypothetical protein
MPGANSRSAGGGAGPLPRGARRLPALRILQCGLLLLLGLQTGIADAEWSGISLNIGDTDVDWKFRDETRTAQISEISFRIEDRTDSGLSVGAAIGYMDLRLVADTDFATRKYSGQYFGIYLRQDYSITDNLSLHGIFGFRYATGDESGDSVINSDVSWSETGLELGIGFRFVNLRIMPFVAWDSVDGDISGDDGTSVFELDDPVTQGIRFDLYVERTAFVRLEFVDGSRRGGYLVFARRY